MSTAKRRPLPPPPPFGLPAKFASLRQARQASAMPRVLSRSTGRMAVLAIAPSDINAQRELRSVGLSACLHLANFRPLARVVEVVVEGIMAACLVQPPSPPAAGCSGSIQASEQGSPFPLCLGRVPGLPHQLKHPVLCVRVYCLTNKGLALFPALIRPSSFVLFPSLPPRRGLLFQLACWCSPLAFSNPIEWSWTVVLFGAQDHRISFSHVPVAKVLSFSVLTEAESQAFNACNV